MASEKVGFYLSRSLHHRLKSYADRIGKKQSRVVEELIRDHIPAGEKQ